MIVIRLLLITLALQAVRTEAEEWPQWMGPGRDNVWQAENTLQQFPPEGPPRVWSAPVAGGYAGPAVARQRVIVTDYVTKENVKVPNFERQKFSGMERVLCLDAGTGQPMWQHEYPVSYSLSYPAGPRCTPTIDGERVYTLGAEGNLYCLDLDSGKPLWSKDFPRDYQTKTALWGYASHPLVDGDKLICIVGGPGSHAVAFDKLTGRERWRAQTAREQGYSPPTIIQAAGVRQLILLAPDAVIALDPETGSEYWSVPYEATSGSIIMSPVRWDRYLYVAGYSNKNLLLQLAEDEPLAEVVWRDERRKGLSPVNVQPFVEDGVLYGLDQNGVMYAVELPSGQRLWETSAPVGPTAVGSGTAFLVRQQSRVWIFNENGELIIARLSRQGYEEVDRAKLIAPTNVAFGRDVVWCPPAFADGCIFVRNDQECACFDLTP